MTDEGEGRPSFAALRSDMATALYRLDTVTATVDMSKKGVTTRREIMWEAPAAPPSEDANCGLWWGSPDLILLEAEGPPTPVTVAGRPCWQVSVADYTIWVDAESALMLQWTDDHSDDGARVTDIEIVPGEPREPDGTGIEAAVTGKRGRSWFAWWSEVEPGGGGDQP